MPNSDLLLTIVMVVLAATAFAVGLVGRSQGSLLAKLGDGVMLLAMVDVCLLGRTIIPAALWGAALVGLALAASIHSRVKGGPQGASCMHPLGMIIGAGVLVLMGAGHAAGGHSHGLGAGAVLALLAVATLAHGAATVASIRGRDVATSKSVHALTSLGSLLAMVAMPFVAGV